MSEVQESSVTENSEDRDELGEVFPWSREGLTDEEKGELFEQYWQMRVQVEKTLKEEEMALVHRMAERLRAAEDEEAFLALVEEFKRGQADDIKETVAIYRGDGNFVVNFDEVAYNVMIVVKPRRRYEHKNNPLLYNIYVRKL